MSTTTITRKILATIMEFVLVVSLGFLWSVGRVWSQEAGSGPFSLDVVLLIDNSQSMADTGDPDGLRIRAAQRLVDRLSDDAETFHLRHRVALVIFGLKVARSTPLMELPNDVVRDRIYAQRIPGSDFREPLDTALQQFRGSSFEPGKRKAVVLFTDGRPQLTGVTLTKEELEAYFSDRAGEFFQDGKGNLTDRIQQLLAENVQIFVVAIGDTDEDRSNWTNLNSEIHYLRLGSPTDVDSVVDSIVEQLTAVVLPSPTAPVPTESPTSTLTTSSPPAPTDTPTPSPSPTSSPTLTPTPTKSPTLTPTPIATPIITPTPTSGIIGPLITPTVTATTRPGGVVMPWSGVGIVVLLIAGLVGGLAAAVLLLKSAKKEFKDVIGKWEEEKKKREKIEEDLEALKEARGASKLEREAEQAEILLQEAREALSKGEIGQARTLAEQVIENATRYGELVLERMAAYTREALDIILQATQDISKYFQDKSVVIQCGLADALKVWWAHHPNEAIEGIYALISKGGQDLLKLVGEREVSWPEGVPGVVKNNAREVENICKSLCGLLSQESDQNLVTLLDEVVRAFGAASETFAHAGDAQALYKCMAQLAEHPLWPMEFPAFPETTLPYFRYVARLLQQGFTLPSPAWEGLPQLKQLEQEVSSHAE